MSRILSIVLMLTVFVMNAQHNWERTNPGGGGAFSTAGASVSGIIIAGSDLSGAYRSTDKGQSWDVIGAKSGLLDTHVSGVGFHRADGDIIYIGTQRGLYRSEDGGDTVVQVLDSGYITDIEFGTDILNVGYTTYHSRHNTKDGAIFKTIDNGITWNQISTDLPADLRILKILINPENANELYILTGKGRRFGGQIDVNCSPADVYKSTNGGENWINLTPSLPEVMDVALSPHDSQNLFITTMNNVGCDMQYYWDHRDLSGQLHTSTDGGNTWTAKATNVGVILLDALDQNKLRLIDPRIPSLGGAGTWLSEDGGDSFTKTNLIENWDTFFNERVRSSYGSSFNGISKTISEDLANPNTYYWVTTQYIYASEDGGNTFNNLFTNEVSEGLWQSRGFDNVNMLDMAISPVNPDIIYQGYFDIGIWRSLDKGETWQSCNPEAYTGNWEGRGGNTATILADTDRQNVVWAGMSSHQKGQDPTYLLKSTEAGEKNSWERSDSGLEFTNGNGREEIKEIMGLSLDVNSQTTNKTLYVTANGGVFKSADDGSNWTYVLDSIHQSRFTAVDKFNSTVYAAGETGLWKATGGDMDSWTRMAHPDMVKTTTSNFWVSSYKGIFDVKTDPNNENWVYVTVLGKGKGLYLSKDAGQTFTKLITDDHMRSVAIMPKNSNYLYATSSSAFKAGGYNAESNGIYFSRDGGATWSKENDGMPYDFAMNVEIDNLERPTVFVGVPGTGYQKAPVPVRELPIADAGDDQELNCSVNEVTLGGNLTSSGDDVNYLWTTVDGNIVSEIDKKEILVDTSGTYKLSVHINGETSIVTDEVQVSLNPGPTATVGEDVFLDFGESIQLEGSGGGQYEWTPTEGLSDPTISNPIASPKVTTTYTLTVTDTNGCQSSEAITVNVTANPVGVSPEESFVIYPVPAHDVLTIYNVNQTEFEVFLYDIQMALMLNQVATEELIEIDVTGLARGNYIVGISDKENNKFSTFKIILE